MGGRASCLPNTQYNRKKMRVVDFKGADKLTPCQHSHPDIGVFYIPELSTFEVEDITSVVTSHCLYLAESKFSESKAFDEKQPTSPNFNYSGQKIAVWQGREAPQNLHEEKVFNKAALVFTQITLTMFLCDAEGNCLCPFDEPFGEVKMERLKLFSKFIQDEDAVKKFNQLLLGDKAINEEKPKNVKPGGKKK